MHQYIKFILFRNDTLHVSDGLSVHHQEFKMLHTATGICKTDTSVCLLVGTPTISFSACQWVLLLLASHKNPGYMKLVSVCMAQLTSSHGSHVAGLRHTHKLNVCMLSTNPNIAFATEFTGAMLAMLLLRNCNI